MSSAPDTLKEKNSHRRKPRLPIPVEEMEPTSLFGEGLGLVRDVWMVRR